MGQSVTRSGYQQIRWSCRQCRLRGGHSDQEAEMLRQRCSLDPSLECPDMTETATWARSVGHVGSRLLVERRGNKHGGGRAIITHGEPGRIEGRR